ncbi:MAG: hypothetical protein KAH97_05620 [Anaerolineales bacterium]|nr:hypothetical protein [Anaerolineales bacterium]
MSIKRYCLLMLKALRESDYSRIVFALMTITIIGIVITNDFGISWDEPLNVTYGVESLRAYYSEPAWQWTLPAGPTGPFSFMLTEIAAQVFRVFRPGWMLADGRHFTYFLMFQIAAISLYGLCLRFSNKRAALLATLLFVTQPLLFGHAFINPKDIPFMAFFSASVAIGLAMVDAHANSHETALRKGPGSEEHRGWTDIWQIWKRMNIKQKGLLFTMSVLSLLAILDILVLNRVILRQLLSLVYSAYQNTATEPINSIFRLIADNAGQIDVTSYMWKATRAYWFLRIPSSIGILFSAILIFGRKFRLTLLEITSKKNSLLIFSGIILGLATSIRIVAPFAGLLVSIYFLAKRGFRGFKPLVFYWCFAAVISFITRPYFWQNPIERVWNSLISTSNFNSSGSVFFQGDTYPATNLPFSYSPTLILRQFTEPLLFLILLGIVIMVWKMLNDNVDRTLLTVVTGWFLVPIAMLRITNVLPYNNFRQFLFITVPLFILASVGIDYFVGKIRSTFLLSIIIVTIFLPGLIGIVRLHPYEYIYYNSLVGGLSSTEGFGELDYWCTSFRAAMDYINEAAPEGSTIAVSRPINNAKPFAREDLKLIKLDKELYADAADYALICTPSVSDDRFSHFETEWEISRDGILLAVVKRVD